MPISISKVTSPSDIEEMPQVPTSVSVAIEIVEILKTDVAAVAAEEAVEAVEAGTASVCTDPIVPLIYIYTLRILDGQAGKTNLCRGSHQNIFFLSREAFGRKICRGTRILVSGVRGY